MLTNVTKSVISATAFGLLSVVGLGLSDRAEAIALNLTTFEVGGDANIDSATQATILSGDAATFGPTLITGGGPGSLQAFLGLTGAAFDTLFPSNTFGSAIRSTVFVNAGEVLTFDFNFTQNASDVSFVTIGTNVFSLASATINGTYSYTFTATGNVDLGIGVLDIDDSIGTSNLVVTNADIAAVPFEFDASGGLLMLGGFFLGKRYLRKSQEK